MTTTQQTVYLITEAQREALLSYLQNRPYKEVAAGIQFLMTAPTAVLNVVAPDAESSAAEPNDAKPEEVILPPTLGEPAPPPHQLKTVKERAAVPPTELASAAK